MSQERRALDATAVSVMVLLTALWGFQQVSIKLIAADVSLVMQAAIRSIAATVLLFAWARMMGQPLFQRDGTLAAGVAAGLLFAFEFVFIYAGLGYTNASRMSVFVYLAPPLTALGLHFHGADPRHAPHPSQRNENAVLPVGCFRAGLAFVLGTARRARHPRG